MPSSGFQHSIVYQQPRQHARSICGHAQPCAWFTAHGAQQNLQKQPGSSYVGMITCLVCGEGSGLRRERWPEYSRGASSQFFGQSAWRFVARGAARRPVQKDQVARASGRRRRRAIELAARVERGAGGVSIGKTAVFCRPLTSGELKIGPRVSSSLGVLLYSSAECERVEAPSIKLMS